MALTYLHQLDPEDLPLNQWNIEEMCGVFFESPTLAPLRRSTTRIRPQLVPKQPTILAASLFISHCWTFSEKCMIWVKYLGMVCSLCSYYARRKIHNVSQCYISVYSVIYMRMMYAVQMIIITYNHLSSYKYICV